MFEQPTVTVTPGNDNGEKIDFKQTIIDFQEKTILTSLVNSYPSSSHKMTQLDLSALTSSKQETD